MIIIATILSVPVAFIVGAILADIFGYGILGTMALIASLVGIPYSVFYFYKNKRYLKKCAFCAEKIKKEASVCIHCSKDQPQKSDFQSFDDKLKYLFLVFILLIILLLVIGNILDLMG